MHDFVDCMANILDFHSEVNITYKLSEEAQSVYDGMVDSYASFINSKYDSGRLINLFNKKIYCVLSRDRTPVARVMGEEHNLYTSRVDVYMLSQYTICT